MYLIVVNQLGPHFKHYALRVIMNYSFGYVHSWSWTVYHNEDEILSLLFVEYLLVGNWWYCFRRELVDGPAWSIRFWRV